MCNTARLVDNIVTSMSFISKQTLSQTNQMSQVKVVISVGEWEITCASHGIKGVEETKPIPEDKKDPPPKFSSNNSLTMFQQ